jgi:hypothetical protein
VFPVHYYRNLDYVTCTSVQLYPRSSQDDFFRSLSGYQFIANPTLHLKSSSTSKCFPPLIHIGYVQFHICISLHLILMRSFSLKYKDATWNAKARLIRLDQVHPSSTLASRNHAQVNSAQLISCRASCLTVCASGRLLLSSFENRSRQGGTATVLLCEP